MASMCGGFCHMTQGHTSLGPKEMESACLCIRGPHRQPRCGCSLRSQKPMDREANVRPASRQWSVTDQTEEWNPEPCHQQQQEQTCSSHGMFSKVHVMLTYETITKARHTHTASCTRKKVRRMGWGDGSGAQTPYCSRRGPEFSSWHTQQAAYNHL